ncbi:hypothetical protein EX895_001375 [Sporisorium graminicola]|uniref:RRM domain-containing protein n=1 Tax=Sporisorium graminicola TaxID=280036 RepID=A0A4U7KYE8_9BASI|nr:hypothetical protein EX895_001375 [Sporisorium graminicola]TKY89590.1 hypothetical protein EX895_001375 [Sporisorium graminicola]
MAPKKSTPAAAAASIANRPRPTRAAAKKVAASVPAAAPAATTSKVNGKKRAAAADHHVDSAPAKKTAKARTKKVATEQADDDEEQEDAGDVNEREIIASLSDVSADSSDDDASDIEQEEANSSDEDDEDDRLATQPRSSLASIKLPNSKDDAVVRARLDKLRKSKTASSSSTTPGVLYIGRLPKGFFEKQLKEYFTQFGDVTRLRVSRNKKTGASKHYAFIEFADKDVASIVQETMHNYLIDGRLLQVKEVPRDKVHPELWVGANRKFAKVPGARLERVVRSRAKTDEEQKRTNDRAIKRQDDRRAKLAKLGIEYEFEGYTQDGGAEKKAKAKATTTTTTASDGKAAKSTPVKAAKSKTAKA